MRSYSIVNKLCNLRQDGKVMQLVTQHYSFTVQNVVLPPTVMPLPITGSPRQIISFKRHSADALSQLFKIFNTYSVGYESNVSELT